jgi:methylenetetrahydrofolate dehydrogenase (NADP+)/methenyltetrahydrofolate cyclohydrolase
MQTKIIDGKKLRNELLEKIKKEVALLSFQPVFCDVLVGDNGASVKYVEMKGRMAEAVGISFHQANFSFSITTTELIEEIKKLNKITNMCGIIVQLPLPSHIDKQAVLDSIDPRLDVDCLGGVQGEKFYNSKGGKYELGPPTALACVELLDSINLELKDKNIVVLGQGTLVGLPVTALLHFRGLFPIVVRSTTENKEEIIKRADIIISGMGQGKYIKGDMIKKGAVLIDAGTSESEGGLVGDVDFESVKDVAGFVTPVPGGVGPVTVAMLLNNVLKVAKTFPLLPV